MFIYFEKATKFQKSSNCFDDTVKSGRFFQIVCGLPIEYMNFEKWNGRSNIYIYDGKIGYEIKIALISELIINKNQLNQFNPEIFFHFRFVNEIFQIGSLWQLCAQQST